MAVVQLTDVIVPDQFSAYTVQNSVEKTALFASGVMVPNGAMADQLKAGADSFTVPFWRDLGDEEANIVNDNPASNAAPRKLSAGRQIVRKAFLHGSWAAMNFASELSGDDALKRIQDRVTAYWARQAQRRLVQTLNGILADNIANDAGDMLHDVTGLSGSAAEFSALAVIEAAGTLGDAMNGLSAIAVHSTIYKRMLAGDLITTIPDSQGGFIQTFRGMAVIVDDGLPVSGVGNDVFTSVLFGGGSIGYAMTEPRIAAGTEVENLPGAGNGGGQQILHSRVNLAVHPSGFAWKETAVAAESPTIAELANATNWDRIIDRKAVNLAFLKSK